MIVKERLKNVFDVMFFGSDRFSVHSLRSLVDQVHGQGIVKSVGVYFNHEKQYRNPVWDLSNILGVNKVIGKPLNDAALIEKFSQYNIAVVSSFGKLIPRSCLDAFVYGAINVHPSLLPRYRGASPIQYAIMNRDNKTGVSIIDVHPYKFDMGKVLKQTEVNLASDATYLSLVDTLGIIGKNELVNTLENYAEYKSNAREQEILGEPSMTKKITLEDSVVDWSKDALHIEALYRAIGYLYHLNSTFRGKRIRLAGIKLANDYSKLTGHIPGTLHVTKQSIYVQCGKGCISASSAAIGNSRFLSPTEFINGYKVSKLDALGSTKME